jgi:hypothetical protein
VIDDPEEVIVDFRESKISDMSAIDAVHKLTERYAKAGKNLRYLVLTVVSCCMLRTMLLILISLRTLLTKWCLIKKNRLDENSSLFFLHQKNFCSFN